MNTTQKQCFYQYEHDENALLSNLTNYLKEKDRVFGEERSSLHRVSINYLNQIIKSCHFETEYFHMVNEKVERDATFQEISKHFQSFLPEFWDAIPSSMQLQNNLKYSSCTHSNDCTLNNLLHCPTEYSAFNYAEDYINLLEKVTRDVRSATLYLIKIKEDFERYPWFRKERIERDFNVEDLCISLCNVNSFLSILASLNRKSKLIEGNKWSTYLLNLDPKLKSLQDKIALSLQRRWLSFDLFKTTFGMYAIDYREEAFLDVILEGVRMLKNFYGLNIALDARLFIHTHRQLGKCVDELVYIDNRGDPTTDNIIPHILEFFKFSPSVSFGWRKLQCKLMINEASWVVKSWSQRKNRKIQVLEAYSSYLLNQLKLIRAELQDCLFRLVKLHYSSGTHRHLLSLLHFRSTYARFIQWSRKINIFQQAYKNFHESCNFAIDFKSLKGWTMPMIYHIFEERIRFSIRVVKVLDPLWEIEEEPTYLNGPDYESKNQNVAISFMKENIPPLSCIFFTKLKCQGYIDVDWIIRTDQEHSSHLAIVFYESSLWQYVSITDPSTFIPPTEVWKELCLVWKSVNLQTQTKEKSKERLSLIIKNAITILQDRLRTDRKLKFKLPISKLVPVYLKCMLEHHGNIKLPSYISQDSSLTSFYTSLSTHRETIQKSFVQKEYQIRQISSDTSYIKEQLFDFQTEKIKEFISHYESIQLSVFRTILIEECLQIPSGVDKSLNSCISNELFLMKRASLSSYHGKEYLRYLHFLENKLHQDAQCVTENILNNTIALNYYDFITNLKNEFLCGQKQYRLHSLVRDRLFLSYKFVFEKAPWCDLLLFSFESAYTFKEVVRKHMNFLEEIETYYMTLANLISDFHQNKDEHHSFLQNSSTSTIDGETQTYTTSTLGNCHNTQPHYRNLPGHLKDIVIPSIFSNPIVSRRWIQNMCDIPSLTHSIEALADSLYEKYKKRHYPLQTLNNLYKLVRLSHLKNLRLDKINRMYRNSKSMKSFADIEQYLQYRSL